MADDVAQPLGDHLKDGVRGPGIELQRRVDLHVDGEPVEPREATRLALDRGSEELGAGATA